MVAGGGTTGQRTWSIVAKKSEQLDLDSRSGGLVVERQAKEIEASWPGNRKQ